MAENKGARVRTVYVVVRAYSPAPVSVVTTRPDRAISESIRMMSGIPHVVGDPQAQCLRFRASEDGRSQVIITSSLVESSAADVDLDTPATRDALELARRRIYDAAQFGHRCGLLQLEPWDSGLSRFRIPSRAETEETFG